ncbi:helix-turn-helix transcriptional regulator [Bradyrhizobium sp. 956_D2_N1_5]|uniref:helix-turn-helix transcriptional regulator n=1 Tax=unclassified Bradyrhizobium TaxID=2631580 RepID=UPI003F1EEC3D
MTTNHLKNLVDTHGAAKHIALSASTLNKLRVYGGGPRFYKLGRRVAYDLADLNSWLDGRRRQSTSEYGPHASSFVTFRHS